MHVVSIPDALQRRMSLVGQALAERIPNGTWQGYRADEGLVGRLTRPAELGGALTADYHRPGHLQTPGRAQPQPGAAHHPGAVRLRRQDLLVCPRRRPSSGLGIYHVPHSVSPCGAPDRR